MTAGDVKAEEPVLSVVIPTHNVQEWVAETLRSILSQDVAGMEVIVVDDHSDDGTPETIQRIVGADPRVTLVHATQQGGGSARNEGVRRARGRYLVFADGDDIVPEGAYRALVSSLKESGSDIAVGDYLKFSPTATWRPTASMTAFDDPVRGVKLADIPTLIFSRPCWNKVFSREFWDRHEITFPDVPRSNDIVPMVTAYVKAERIDVVEDVVYLYRDRPGGTSMTSKASSSASLVSYLTQEKICAALIASVESADLSSRYSALIHDRDGFFHVKKFLSSWTAPQESDAEVVRLLSELIAMADPAAAWIDRRKRVALQLFAGGSILAARAVAQTVDRGGWRADEGHIRLQAVRALLEDVESAAPGEMNDGDLLNQVADALGNVRIADDEIEAAWVELARVAEARFGDRLRSLIPEFAGGHVETSAERQRAFGGSTTPLFGSDLLRVHARTTSSEATPVLWSANAVVRPKRLTWSVAEQGYTCEAEFATSQLPQGVLVQPAFLFADGVVVSGYADSAVPEYSPFDNVLYEQHGAWVRLERRAHWLIRAPRRAVITAFSMVRGLVRGRSA